MTDYTPDDRRDDARAALDTIPPHRCPVTVPMVQKIIAEIAATSPKWGRDLHDLGALRAEITREGFGEILVEAVFDLLTKQMSEVV